MQQWALITGAGTGIGRATAEALIARDIAIIAVGRREQPLQTLQKDYPDHVRYVVADIADERQRKKIIDQLDDIGQLNYLVQNAALVEPAGDLLSADPKAFHQMMRVNVEAPLYLAQACVKKMSVGSRILHIGSGAAHNNAPGIRPYSVSKAAFYSMFLGLREELAEQQIGVLSVRPGVVDTPMQATMRELSHDCKGLMWSQEIKDRLVPVESVACMLSWLLCDLPADRLNEREEWDVYDQSLQSEWCKGVASPVNPR